jgi:two-component system sensor histidine kinase YesM
MLSCQCQFRPNVQGVGRLQIANTLKLKLAMGIIAVMLPLAGFTFYNNINAKAVVEQKVTETYSNTLGIFTARVDDTLMQINEYLYKMETQDADIGVIQAYPYLSDTYMLTKVRLTQKMIRDVGFYNYMNTIFIYTGEDLIHASTSNMNEIVMLGIIKEHLDWLIEVSKNQVQDDWHLIYDEDVEGNYLLARLSELNTGLYGGVFVRVVDIADTLDIIWNKGDIGETVIYSHTGQELTQPLTPSIRELSLQHMKVSPSVQTETVTEPESGERYLVMSQSSELAMLVYNIVIPEAAMLENIPFLQKATYFIPIFVIIVLLFFLVYINQVVFKPLGELMRGMKKISMGDLETRLEENKTTEFNFLANSFNNMAGEVKDLKIGVYEEQLRVQQAEFKHLQAQISPHFYMNSLNIIYNFAALGDNESVKKMSLHLADYFRFIMKTNRSTITLDEELKHIGNYLEIQKIRFPGKLVYEINLAPEILSKQIPALTIQPFVENSIIHGFKNRRQLFHIRIFAEIHTDTRQLILYIQDTGVGFPQDLLTSVADDSPLSRQDSSGLGIQNVIHRLQLHYKNKVSIAFNNGEQGGAIVAIYLPIEGEPADV